MQTEQKHPPLGEQAGYLWTWWKGDPLPTLPPSPDLTTTSTTNISTLANLMSYSHADITHLIEQGHRPYIACVRSQPVAVGWLATNEASFGGGLATFHLPTRNRYLYNFITQPAWRGRGIYPRLLQYILSTESTDNDRFWIVHQFANTASKRGIAKAGFQIASSVYFLNANKLCLIASPQATERAEAGAALLNLPLFIREPE